MSGVEGCTFLPLSEQIRLAGKSDLKALGKVIAEEVLTLRPDAMIVHDFGLTTGLLGLIRARRKDPSLKIKLVAFNGAMRGFDVFKSTHPFTMQLMTFEKLKKIMNAKGIEVDPYFENKMLEARALYRQVIAMSLISNFCSIFRKQTTLNIDSGDLALILASTNDPFIPFKCLELLKQDIKNSLLEKVEYGHFPYLNETPDLKTKTLNFLGMGP